jgi:hypothetical protein
VRRRNPHGAASLRAAEQRARDAISARLAEQARQERADRITSVRARLELAGARRASTAVIVGLDMYARSPTSPTMERLAARVRRIPGYLDAVARIAGEQRADLLVGVTDSHLDIDWESTP